VIVEVIVYKKNIYIRKHTTYQPNDHLVLWVLVARTAEKTIGPARGYVVVYPYIGQRGAKWAQVVDNAIG